MLSIVLLVQSVMVNANAEEIADKPEFEITSSAAKGSEYCHYSHRYNSLFSTVFIGNNSSWRHIS